MKEFKLFFSWQSDDNKTKKIILDAIHKAVHDIKVFHNYSIIVEESTSNTPGSPQIVETILGKIDSCDIFIADVTPVCDYQKEIDDSHTLIKQVPNPNVLMELGYAMSAVGMHYTICIAHQGKWSPNDLPFDINHNRIYQFTSKNCDISDKIFEVIKYINKHGRHRHKAVPYMVHQFAVYREKIIKKLSQDNKKNDKYAYAEPIIYFNERMSKAFHGKRGLVTYTKTKDIRRCLNNLFSSPLTLKKAKSKYDGHFSILWWYRGSLSSDIDNYRHLGGRHFLIQTMEVNVKKIIAYVDPSGRYYGQYVYIETYPDKPTGIYAPYSENHIEEIRKELGYYSEEYGVFKIMGWEKNVSINEYDDGHTLFLGKLISPTRKNKELRERFLTPFNFIITSFQSSINCDQFAQSDNYFNKLIQGEMTIEQFNNYLKKFPKPMDDY